MKTRNGFVSNSSSSSFVIGTILNFRPNSPLPPGNPLEAWEWLKSVSNLRNTKGIHLWRNGRGVDFRYEANENCYKEDKVVEYEGCCDYCYGPLNEWIKGEFIEEFTTDQFQFSQEQVDEYLRKNS